MYSYARNTALYTMAAVILSVATFSSAAAQYVDTVIEIILPSTYRTSDLILTFGGEDIHFIDDNGIATASVGPNSLNEVLPVYDIEIRFKPADSWIREVQLKFSIPLCPSDFRCPARRIFIPEFGPSYNRARVLSDCRGTQNGFRAYFEAYVFCRAAFQHAVAHNAANQDDAMMAAWGWFHSAYNISTIYYAGGNRDVDPKFYIFPWDNDAESAVLRYLRGSRSTYFTNLIGQTSSRLEENIVDGRLQFLRSLSFVNILLAVSFDYASEFVRRISRENSSLSSELASVIRRSDLEYLAGIESQFGGLLM